MPFQGQVNLEQRVAVFKFSMYDIAQDQYIVSKRWGTVDAIERCGGVVDRNSERVIDASDIKSDVPGMTKIGF